MERKKLVGGICFFNFELGNTVLKDQETKSSNFPFSSHDHVPKSRENLSEPESENKHQHQLKCMP